ncbi:hypothetical protein Bca101_035496 [Brassica carinata]
MLQGLYEESYFLIFPRNGVKLIIMELWKRCRVEETGQQLSEIVLLHISTPIGVVDVNSGRRYNKFEPFILASQAEQVSFLPYPRLRSSGINWLATIKITPRGRIVAGEEPPLQEEDAINEVEVPDQQLDENLLIDPNNHQYEDLPEDETDEAREDEFDCSDDDDCSDVDENSNDSE